MSYYGIFNLVNSYDASVKVLLYLLLRYLPSILLFLTYTIFDILFFKTFKIVFKLFLKFKVSI